ncbi:MAG TPA: type VI secretion system tip protein TssI/VgrG [Myxococcaceae bacterium]|nr:type VI secretion system tip protein TssI/VgrG [Myxococcaceae bacterium]
MKQRNLIGELAIDGIDPATFRLAEVNVHESLFDGYRVRIEAIAREEVDLPAVLGKRASFAIHLDDQVVRRFHGLILRAGADFAREGLYKLSFELGSRIELLKQGKSSRIFQDMSVVEIVRKVLEEAQLSGKAQAWSVASPPKREYVVQWNESDFDFIRRLLSEEGIGFSIDNANDQDQIVFFDDSKSLPKISGEAALADRDSTQLKHDTVTDVADCSAGRSDAVMLRDYDFKRPGFDLSSKEKAPRATDREVYQHPGNYVDAKVGKRFAKQTLERLRSGARTIRGSSDCPRLEPGKLFRIENHPRGALNDEYLLISVSHRAHTAGEGDEGAVPYRNDFTAIPKAVPYRPPEIPSPLTPGIQLAFVTCPPGEEIHADDFGRVKVRFPWDRSGTKDDKSSAWLRVGQVPLGGSMVLPRGDFEVIVDFELGDLDRPFVAGHLYNDEKGPPYALPAGKTRSSLQTATTRGGPGANELRFEDSAGKEEIFFNASKDLAIAVENDGSTQVTHNETSKVGVNRTLRVGTTHTAEVVANRTVSVGVSQKVNVGKDLSDSIGGSEKVSVGAVRKVVVGGDHVESCVGPLTRTVGALQAVTTIRGYKREIVGASSNQVGAAWLELMGKNRGSTVGGGRTELVGALKLVKAKQMSVSAGAAMVTNAAVENVKCGGNRSDSADGALALTAGGGMSVKASNITIEAKDMLVLIAGTCSIKLTSDGTVELTAPTVNLTGVEALSQVQHKSN